MVAQVTAASEDELGTPEEIGRCIVDIASVTQLSAAGIQQIAHTFEDLNRFIVNLQELISYSV